MLPAFQTQHGPDLLRVKQMLMDGLLLVIVIFWLATRIPQGGRLRSGGHHGGADDAEQ